MTDYDGFDLVDRSRSADLGDVGAADYIAATAVKADGSTDLLLVRRDRLGDHTAVYDPNCAGASHEQLGPLPLEYIRRLTVSQRANRHNPEGTP